MRISSPTTDWNTYSTAKNKILQWKIYCRKVTTLTESLTSGPTNFTDVTSYVRELPTISQQIELEAGQFTSDSFTISANNINYWLTNWLDVSSSQQLEFKITCNLSLTGSSFTTDTPILASGFFDKMSVEFDETSDGVSFNVFSYDEYANRITGKNLTLQKTRSISGNTCLVCNRIPGVYIYTAAPYLNLQTLNFEWNDSDSIYQIKYNGGDFTTIATAYSQFTDIRDENNKLCQIITLPSELEKGTFEQKFIFRNSTDSLPYLFYDDETIANMLSKVAELMPIVSSSITTPTFSPYDSGYRLSNLENITNDVGNARPKCIEWDSYNNVFWIGVGNMLYSRTTGGAWTLKATFDDNLSFGTIKRIWVNRAASHGHIWVLLKSDETENFYLGKLVVLSGVATEFNTTKSSSGGDIQNDFSNFYLYSPATGGGIYWVNSSSEIKFLSFVSETVSTLGGSYSGLFRQTFSFYSDFFGFFCLRDSSGTYRLFSQSMGSEQSVNLPSLIYNVIIASDVSGTCIIYFTASNNLIYKYTITGSSGSNFGSLSSPISSTITAYGLYKSGTNIYFSGNNVISGSTYYPFAYLNTSTDTITTLSNNQYYVDNADFEVRQNMLVYVSGVIYLITPGGRFYQFTNSNTNRINGTYDTSGISIRDCLNEFCRIYNLIYLCKPDKTLKIFPRSDSTGQIQTSGNATQLEISSNNINNLTNKLGDFGKANKVKIQSNGFTGEYNGTDYDVFDVDDSKIIEINSDLIQHSNGWTLRDMAKHFYPFYSRELKVVSAEVGSASFEYEVLDGISVELSGTKINTGTLTNEESLELLTEGSVDLSAENTTGLLQRQSISANGNMEIEVLV